MDATSPTSDENGNWLIESEFIDPEFR